MTEWLVDTLLATSVLLLFVLLARGTVARHFGASVAYWLWLLPAARLFMPALTKDVASPPPAETGQLIELAGNGTNAAVPNAVPASVVMTSEVAINWFAIGLTLWFGGAVLLFIVQMVRYCALRDELLGDAVEIDRVGDIRVVQTDRIGGPLAFGLWRRFIAVPDHFTTTFAPKERDLALAHELAHHRAGDLYANLAAFIFLCLQWFNPLAWLAWNAFRFDQEAACDARVLDGTDLQTRQSYGRALARSAADQTPALAMAMALNAPSTIVRRLRRLMMNDTSKRRRLVGRVSVFVAVSIALPLTATVIPVFAEDKPADGQNAEVIKHKAKIIVIKGKDGENVHVDVRGDSTTPFVRTIQKDGKTIVLRSNRELSDADIEKMLAEAEASRAEAEKAASEADMAKAEAAMAADEAEMARAESAVARTEAAHAHAIAITRKMDFGSYIPEIDISEIRSNCEKGQPVSTDVSGFDGKNKSRVRIVMCGKGQAKAARVEALRGLREARADIEDDKDIPENVRKSVLGSLKKQIEEMENQISKADNEDSNE